MVTPAKGNHLYGGNMSLQATATPGFYTLTLTFFIDKRNIEPNSIDDILPVYVFSKRTNARIDKFDLLKGATQNLLKSSNACDALIKLELQTLQYTKTINLTSSKYSDDQGYYIIYERCCRNVDILNIQNPGNTGLTFRMDFPPIVRNGIGFTNSSPDFGLPPADYVCINRPFKVSFKATDSDGDRLQYELIDPLAGYTSRSTTNPLAVFGTGNSYATYPAVQWQGGFSAAKAIPGNPSLQINATTGELTLRATQVGLYTFAVLVREFRNGVEIGQVRREYQFPVVDCQSNTTTPPIVSVNGQSVSALQHCETTPVTLSIPTDTNFVYQWQRDGQDLSGETSTTLTASNLGTYTVQKKFVQNCGIDTTSQAVQLYCETFLYMPTAFTPNGDGVNDSWQIQNIESLAEADVTIFDRWGSVVFNSKGYKTPWDGTYKTEKVPVGPYTYQITVPNQKPYRGSVQVLY
jgi:gliding motility-associated-like protein